ncbi:nicotinamidase-like amidase [Rivularia sp. PCC 7116]|uniref:cysteine hydrolase n=1 Tax=Rivularia sp. PCC 7116 TaxID=373994 RepID=UPI00029ECBEC|nr:cysteine hydrolase [Rivularia sp. PCC 7116]AFY57719.1 nicotinamidase-like amidase [Rivularia sp. PCC 7116]
MENAFGLEIPQSLEEICHPNRMAILIYDMQVGIMNQLPKEKTQTITNNILKVLAAARKGGFRVFFCRHLSLPKEVAGVFQLRQAMTWQGTNKIDEFNPWFLRDSDDFQLIPELSPLPSEVIFDKITMSAFEGTFLDIALKDCGIISFAIMGIATEIGIEPTIRHGADRGYIPVIVTDACGAGNDEAGKRSLESIKFTADAVMTEVDTICSLLNPS